MPTSLCVCAINGFRICERHAARECALCVRARCVWETCPISDNATSFTENEMRNKNAYAERRTACWLLECACRYHRHQIPRRTPNTLFVLILDTSDDDTNAIQICEPGQPRMHRTNTNIF